MSIQISKIVKVSPGAFASFPAGTLSPELALPVVFIQELAAQRAREARHSARILFLFDNSGPWSFKALFRSRAIDEQEQAARTYRRARQALGIE